MLVLRVQEPPEQMEKLQRTEWGWRETETKREQVHWEGAWRCEAEKRLQTGWRMLMRTLIKCRSTLMYDTTLCMEYRTSLQKTSDWTSGHWLSFKLWNRQIVDCTNWTNCDLYPCNRPVTNSKSKFKRIEEDVSFTCRIACLTAICYFLKTILSSCKILQRECWL